MRLVIVESPTKAKTISKFLSKEYIVESSYGHVRDLPKSKIGIDVKKDFAPQYVVPKKALERVAELKNISERAETIILATDEDREGEAIAWHLAEVLELNGKPAERIVFHEITKEAILDALKHPRALDTNLIDAQQARRVLDRLVGYELSPFLWRKIRYGLSAGRVQSVAVRLMVEREREIEKFNKEEYWSIEAIFKKGKADFSARLYSAEGKTLGKMDLKTGEEAERLVRDAKNGEHNVTNVSVREVSRNPAPPFTTSTLQQEAARKLGYSAKQTMMIAQKLYEHGHITYMRTDSVNLASSALEQAAKVIRETFGEKYALPEPKRYATKSKGAQEAHEAIRPTNLAKKPGGKGALKDRGHARLYDLIWKRTIASQMQSAVLEQTSADIGHLPNKDFVFRATGQVVRFDGFIRAYTEGTDENEPGTLEEGMLPPLAEGDAVTLQKIDPIQHFTEPPPRYTDATLVKALEAEGVGRPSTYAPTLSTVQERGYVEKIEKRYHPTDIGIVVNDLLVEHFPEIVDIKFTSHIEEELDEVAAGNIPWKKVCREFYEPFKKHLTEKEATVEKHIELSEIPCPHCGKPMLIKFGRMGKFLACPEEGSRVTLPLPEEAAMIKELEEKTRDEHCPICEKPMRVKRGRFGYFLGCGDYPKCKGISKIWNKTGFICPVCLEDAVRKEKPGEVVEKKRRGRGKPFYACTRWPDCTFVMNKKPEAQTDIEVALGEWKAKLENPPEKTTGAKKKRKEKKEER